MGSGGTKLLQQRYLPNAWSRNTNTAAVMTERGAEKDEGKEMSDGECSSHFLPNQSSGLIVTTKCFNNPKCPHSFHSSSDGFLSLLFS